MPKISYVEKRFGTEGRELIRQANAIIAEYQAQGFKLTLRQLYYQYVSRDLIPNTMKSYKRLGSYINDGRLAGLIDWDAIVDRTREVASQPHWENPADIVSACAKQFRIDKWANQKYRPEIWIEKEALAGVIEGVCRELDISYLSCRGYTSQSEMWSSAMRMADTIRAGQIPLLLHFGDHDPSGLDMSRDIKDRLKLFICGEAEDVEFRRLALNMPQIQEFHPPPNPAKVTDSRFENYQREFGSESWELDALEPRALVALIRDTVEAVREADKWEAKVAEETAHREHLTSVANQWEEVVERFGS